MDFLGILRMAKTVDSARECDSVQRFKDRLAAEDQMRDTEKPSTSARRPDEAFTQAEWKAAALHASTASLDHARTIARIAAILATFYRAELSMSSVQPLLALAIELNPDLVE